MRPDLFNFKPDIPGYDDDNTPWAMSLSGGNWVPLTPACPGCGGRRMGRRGGPGRASHITGSYWPDIMGAGSSSPNYMVSERVVDQLHAVGATGFTSYPVQLAVVQSPALKRVPQPNYFYLEITGLVRIDPVASGMAGWLERNSCEVCGAPLRAMINTPERLLPRKDGWDGSDFCNADLRGGPFCSYRVLELARQHRWTNFRFYAIDENHELITGSDGIDYLGEQWPPAWYMDSFSLGKSPREWVDEFFSINAQTPDADLAYGIARRALLDLGEEALPMMLERYRKGDMPMRAAHGILIVAQGGAAVPPDVMDRSEQLVWAEDAKGGREGDIPARSRPS